MTNTSNRKKRNKRLLTLFFVLINIAVIAVIGYREFGVDHPQSRPVVEEERPIFFVIGVLCFLAVLGVETLKYYLMIRDIEGRKDWKTAMGCAITGKYYDNITPLGTGGEAFQIVYLKKKGLSTAASAVVPIIDFMMLQAAFIVLTLVVMFFGHDMLEELVSLRVLGYVGLVFYSLVPLMIILFCAFPKVLHRFVTWACNLMCKLHLIKEPEAAANRAIHALSQYQEGMLDMKSKPLLLVKLLSLSFLYRALIFCMPYCALMAFGAKINFIETFCKVVFIYAAITIIPTPGNAGAAEGSFYMVFASLTGEDVLWAVLFWRCLCYYSWLLSGILLMSMSAFKTSGHPKVVFTDEELEKMEEAEIKKYGEYRD